jgi:hypothetical protein
MKRGMSATGTARPGMVERVHPCPLAGSHTARGSATSFRVTSASARSPSERYPASGPIPATAYATKRGDAKVTLPRTVNSGTGPASASEVLPPTGATGPTSGSGFAVPPSCSAFAAIPVS